MSGLAGRSGDGLSHSLDHLLRLVQFEHRVAVEPRAGKDGLQRREPLVERLVHRVANSVHDNLGRALDLDVCAIARPDSVDDRGTAGFRNQPDLEPAVDPGGLGDGQADPVDGYVSTGEEVGHVLPRNGKPDQLVASAGPCLGNLRDEVDVAGEEMTADLGIGGGGAFQVDRPTGGDVAQVGCPQALQHYVETPGQGVPLGGRGQADTVDGDAGTPFEPLVEAFRQNDLEGAQTIVTANPDDFANALNNPGEHA